DSCRRSGRAAGASGQAAGASRPADCRAERAVVGDAELADITVVAGQQSDGQVGHLRRQGAVLSLRLAGSTVDVHRGSARSYGDGRFPLWRPRRATVEASIAPGRFMTVTAARVHDGEVSTRPSSRSGRPTSAVGVPTPESAVVETADADVEAARQIPM